MTTFSVDSIAQNGACHKLVSREAAEAQQRAHFAALDRLEAGSVERSRLANRLCRKNGLIRWSGNNQALIVHIGGQREERAERCAVCDDGAWPEPELIKEDGYNRYPETIDLKNRDGVCEKHPNATRLFGLGCSECLGIEPVSRMERAKNGAKLLAEVA